MSKPITIKINNFSGGVSDSTRKPTTNEFIHSSHFDIFTDPFKLIPYRSLEADTETSVSATDLKQYLVRDFKYASASTKLYGLGQTGAGLTKIVYKAVAESGLWTLPSSSEGNGAVKNGCFFEFKDYIWGFQGTNQLFKWGTLSGTPSITNSVTTVGSTITSVADGIIHPATGYAYLAYNNVLVRIQSDGTTVTDLAKTVPDNYKITSLSIVGTNIAIGCSPKDSFNGNSKLFIWNGSSDLFYDTIDCGDGDLRICESVEGLLITVTDRYLNNSVGAGRGSLIIGAYDGGSWKIIKEFFTKKLVGKTIPTSKVVKNNRLFFAAKLMTNDAGTEYNEGIWSFGRKNSAYPFSVTLDMVDENIDTDGIQAFGSAGNFFFIAHSGDGSVDKTDDTATYSFTSIYESQTIDFGDASVLKAINKLNLTVSPLPSGATATLKIRVNENTAWTTIGSITTTGKISRDFYNIESSGVDFPTFQEMQIRLESTGGAEITSFSITATPLSGSENT